MSYEPWMHPRQETLNQVGGEEETRERFFEVDLKDGVKS